jgi:hypothetical protein
MLARLGALLAVGVGGLFAAAPMPPVHATEEGSAHRHPARLYNGDSIRLLLSPEPLSSERFMAYYLIAYR